MPRTPPPAPHPTTPTASGPAPQGDTCPPLVSLHAFTGCPCSEPHPHQQGPPRHLDDPQDLIPTSCHPGAHTHPGAQNRNGEGAILYPSRILSASHGAVTRLSIPPPDSPLTPFPLTRHHPPPGQPACARPPLRGLPEATGPFLHLIHRSYKNPRALSTSSPCSEPSYGSPQLLPSTQPPQMPTRPQGLCTHSSLPWPATPPSGQPSPGHSHTW